MHGFDVQPRWADDGGTRQDLVSATESWFVYSSRTEVYWCTIRGSLNFPD
jgi:hypothetical protein